MRQDFPLAGVASLVEFSGLIFDMDGILIDSEPFWRQAEIELFATVGVHLTEEDCVETMGLRIDEVVAHRAPHADQAELAGLIVDRVEELVRQQGEPLPGSLQVLQRVEALGLPCGLATSSSYQLLEATLETLGLKSYFQIVHSAQEEVYGKPHPAVYLSAAEKLGLPPTRCLAIEDSLNGVIAAKAARMPVVAIPEEAVRNDRRFQVADVQLDSLFELMPMLSDAVGD